MARPDAVIRLRFTQNAQSGQTATQGVETFSNSFARQVVTQVAVAASERLFNAARRRLMTLIRGAVNAELTQMASMVARFSIQPDKATGLSGYISSADKAASGLAREQRWGSGFREYDLSKSGVYWKDRTFQYMLWKEKQGEGTDWWKLSGDLNKRLGQKAFYTTNFGPVRVDFKRTATGNRIPRNITSLGRGRPSLDYQVGTVTVSLLGRITPSMLPALTSDNPYDAVSPFRWSSKVTSLIADKSIRDKLNSAPHGEYRSVLEPFLSHYLTRAVPNAVSNIVERTVESATAGAGRGRDGTGEEFGLGKL